MLKKHNERLLALDVMRGLTIVGMILFNTSSGHHYAPLYHARWIGLTPADLAFPFFMFIMGITTYISLRRYDFEFSRAALRKILFRSIGICFICIAFDWFGHFFFYWRNPDNDISFVHQLLQSVAYWDGLRLSGVLVRLGVCYGICAVIAITVRHRLIPYIIAGILAIYTVILLVGNGFVQDETNILGIIDRAVLGVNHMCNDQGIDPEGVLSTLPSVAHVLIGFMVGSYLLNSRSDGDSLNNRIRNLLLVGTLFIFLAYLLQYGCPISKKIWSPTFVLVTCGAGSCLLAMLLYLIDQKGYKGRWTGFFKVFGANPLFIYLFSEFIPWPFWFFKVESEGNELNVWDFMYQNIAAPLFGEHGGDLAMALFVVSLCWLMGWLLYRRHIFIKL